MTIDKVDSSLRPRDGTMAGSTVASARVASSDNDERTDGCNTPVGETSPASRAPRKPAGLGSNGTSIQPAPGVVLLNAANLTNTVGQHSNGKRSISAAQAAAGIGSTGTPSSAGNSPVRPPSTITKRWSQSLPVGQSRNDEENVREQVRSQTYAVARWYDALDARERAFLLRTLYNRSSEPQLRSFEAVLAASLTRESLLPSPDVAPKRYDAFDAFDSFERITREIPRDISREVPRAGTNTTAPDDSKFRVGPTTGPGSPFAVGSVGSSKSDMYHHAFLPRGSATFATPWDINRPKSATAWHSSPGPIGSVSSVASVAVVGIGNTVGGVASTNSVSSVNSINSINSVNSINSMNSAGSVTSGSSVSSGGSAGSVGSMGSMGTMGTMGSGAVTPKLSQKSWATPSPIGPKPPSTLSVTSNAAARSNSVPIEERRRPWSAQPGVNTQSSSPATGNVQASSASPQSTQSHQQMQNAQPPLQSFAPGTNVTPSSTGYSGPTSPLLSPQSNNQKRGVNFMDPMLLADMGAWLRSLRLHKYTGNLSDMPWQQVVQLSDAELEARGVNALGARRKMLKMFEEIRAAQEAGELPS